MKINGLWGSILGEIQQRPSEQKKRDSEETAFGQFHKWATDNKARVKAIYPENFEKRRIRYDNWSSILQHLITHRGQVTDSVIERCAEAIPASVTLRAIENSVTELDAMLVRAAVFTLLARGNLQCDSLDTIPLNSNTKMTRV